MPRFQIGDRVRIIGNNNGHVYNIGDVIYLHNKYPSGRAWYTCREPDGRVVSAGIVLESDIELLNTSSQTKLKGFGRWVLALEAGLEN